MINFCRVVSAETAIFLKSWGGSAMFWVTKQEHWLKMKWFSEDYCWEVIYIFSARTSSRLKILSTLDLRMVSKSKRGRKCSMRYIPWLFVTMWLRCWTRTYVVCREVLLISWRWWVLLRNWVLCLLRGMRNWLWLMDLRDGRSFKFCRCFPSHPSLKIWGLWLEILMGISGTSSKVQMWWWGTK